MLTMALKIILILGGCLLLPILGVLFESHIKPISSIGIAGMLLGSIVSLFGFGLIVSWSDLGTYLGYYVALVVFFSAWLSFLFLSFSAYSTQLNK